MGYIAKIINYSFTPVTKKIVFKDVAFVSTLAIQYIYNVTRGKYLYNYSSPTPISTDGTNIVTVSANTKGMLYTDVLDITYYFSESTGTGGTNIYNSDGILIGPRVLDGFGYNFTLDNLNAFTIVTDSLDIAIASGNCTISGLLNNTNQNRLLGQYGTDGSVGYVTIGTGLSLSSGVLSVVGVGTGTVTSIASGNGMNFSTITSTGIVTLGTPSNITLVSTNSVSGTTHSHAFAPGGTTAQYIRGDGSLATYTSVTPAALTKVDDTNVTLTLGGTPATALLQATSLTLGWTGTLADGRIASAATWNAKQDALVSGTNIKTINGTTLLGSGDLVVGGAAAWGAIIGTLSAQTDLQTALDGKVDENGAITGATKTKITYDTKGLITSGADATTADIADSTNKRYVTDAQLVVIGNTSGTNTGDQTTISGNAATATALQTARAIYGNNFDGTAALTQIIASTYGGTGNGFTKFSGPTTTEKTKTLIDANDTILELSGSYTPTGTWTSLTMVTPVLGTPTSGNLANCTFPTLNQNTSGSAGSVANSLSIGAELISGGASSYNGSVAKTLGIQASSVTNGMLAGSIAYSKLSLTGAVLNADLAGSIASSKLVGTDIATIGTVTSGTLSTGAVISGVTMTLGSDANYDIYYRNASGVLTRLAAGTDGYLLTTHSTVSAPTWTAPGTGTVTSVTGTANRITSTGGTTPVIDISASYVGQSSITTLGTITSGTWNGTLINYAYLGTGGGGATKFLREDNTWQTVSGSGDMVLASVQTVTGLKTFDKDKLATKGTSTGVVTISNALTTGTSRTFTLPDVDITAAQLTKLTTSTSAATASTIVERDANSNITANNTLGGYTTTATAAGTTTLTVASTYDQFFTGATTQTVVLPDATTLSLGTVYHIVNNSTGIVTVNKNGATLVVAMDPSTDLFVQVTDISSAAGTWSSSYSGGLMIGGSKTLASNFTTSATTAGGVATNLTFTVLANEIYDVIIDGTCSKATSSTGLKLAINAPSGAVIKGEQYGGGATLAAALVPSLITTINTLGTTLATGTAVEVGFRLSFRIKMSSTAGAVSLYAATVTSNTMTIYAGTRMTWTRATEV